MCSPSSQESEWDIIKLALARIRIIEDEEGKLTMYPKNAREANMSENLFHYIKTSIEKYNADLETGCISTRSSFQSNGEGDSFTGPGDCVAWAVSGVLPNVSYEEANSWLTAKYGNNGVPSDEIYTALSHFGNVKYVDPSYINGSLDKCVVIHEGHAMRGLYVNGDYIFCRDDQSIHYNTGNPIVYHSIYSVTIYQYY